MQFGVILLLDLLAEPATGPRRRLSVVRADLAALRSAAHLHGATVNDAVSVAVAGALGQVLKARGEHLGTLVVTVPV